MKPEVTMKNNPHGISRRNFIKTAGAAGIGAAFSPLAAPNRVDATATVEAAESAGVPKRPFGRSGIDVPILSLGGMFDIPSNQTLLKQAIRWGVTYWDTAHVYSGGRSEEGIGQFFKAYPDQRENIFLVTKSTARSPRGLNQDLNTSLGRMNTDYVDLFFRACHSRRQCHGQRFKGLGPSTEGRRPYPPVRLLHAFQHGAVPAGRRKSGLDRRHHDDLQLPVDA